MRKNQNIFLCVILSVFAAAICFGCSNNASVQTTAPPPQTPAQAQAATQAILNDPNVPPQLKAQAAGTRYVPGATNAQNNAAMGIPPAAH